MDNRKCATDTPTPAELVTSYIKGTDSVGNACLSLWRNLLRLTTCTPGRPAV